MHPIVPPPKDAYQGAGGLLRARDVQSQCGTFPDCTRARPTTHRRQPGVYDKAAAGTVTETQHELLDAASGEASARIVSSSFGIGQGGWGGPNCAVARQS